MSTPVCAGSKIRAKNLQPEPKVPYQACMCKRGCINLQSKRGRERELCMPLLYKGFSWKSHTHRKPVGVSSFSYNVSLSIIFVSTPVSLTLLQLPYLVWTKVSKPHTGAQASVHTRWGIQPCSSASTLWAFSHPSFSKKSFRSWQGLKKVCVGITSHQGQGKTFRWEGQEL